MRSTINVRGVSIRIQGRLVRIARLESEKHTSIYDPEALLCELRGSRQRIDLFTFTQSSPDIGRRYKYTLEWDNLAVLPISTFEEWVTHQIRFAPRGRLRQSEKKGVTVREVPFGQTLIEGIWQVYNECPIRQGKRFRHYGKDIPAVREAESTFLDRSIFIGAFLGDALIGFVKLVLNDVGTQARLIEIASMVKHRDKCPTNALIAQTVRSCAERGVRFLIYEKLDYGKKAPDGLRQFKEVNGFQRVDVPRYYVPLTSVGRIALRLRLHHGLSEYVPPWAFEKLRRARNAWYSWRFRSALNSNYS